MARIHRAKLAAEADVVGPPVVCASGLKIGKADAARVYQVFQAVERGFRDLRRTELHPVYRRRMTGSPHTSSWAGSG